MIMTDDATRSTDEQAIERGIRAQDARRARFGRPSSTARATTESDAEASVDVDAVNGVSQRRLGELRNRAVEAMRFAPSWLKQIQMPPGTSPGSVIPVVGSFEELYRIAQIACLNGQPLEEIEEFFRGKEDVRVLELSSCEQRAIVTTDHRNRTHTVSLRGTKNIKNVAQNLRLGAAPTGRAEDVPVPMHRGYRNIAQRCLEAIEPLLLDGYELQLTGHSLGGAAAVALALLLHQKKKTKIRRVVTFGSPKLGPKETAQAIEEIDILRVVQKDDIIPLLPMSRPLVRRPYCHVGEGLVLDNDRPGVFADLPREWGAAGILWRQRVSIESVMNTTTVSTMEASQVTRQVSNVAKGVAKGLSKPITAAKRARTSFLAAFSMPTNEIELEAEVKDLIAATESKESFLSIQEEFDASSASPGVFEDQNETATQRIGPTIFERLWALRQYSPEERVERLDSHRMYRYVAIIRDTIENQPTRVPLADIYEPSTSPKKSRETPIPQLSKAILSIRSR